MKAAVILLLAGISVGHCQLTANQRIGAYSGGGGGGSWRQSGLRQLREPSDAFAIHGVFAQIRGGCVEVDTEQDVNGSWSTVTVAIEKYPYTGELVSGHEFYCVAKLKGVTNGQSGRKVEKYEWFDLDAYQAAKAETNARLAAEAAQRRQQANQEAAQRAKEIALKYNQDAAAKGDAYGLLRMGERYRDGEGVDKDLTKARDYLQRAADAGSPSAKEALSKLSSP